MLPRADRIRTAWCGFATLPTGVGLRYLQTLRAAGRLVGNRESLVGKATKDLTRCSSVPLSLCVSFFGSRVLQIVCRKF